MRITKFSLCLAALTLPALALDQLPTYHFENLTATDGSIQQCVVFTTVPGVKYQIQVSSDLETWTTTSEVYGLGQDVVTALREYVPAPPPDPNAPPPSGNPEIVTSLIFQPLSGSTGGTVVSWVSLDTGMGMAVAIPEIMGSGWNSVPMF